MSTGFDEWCWGQNVFYAGFGFTNWINDVCMDPMVDKTGKVNFVSDDDGYRVSDEPTRKKATLVQRGSRWTRC